MNEAREDYAVRSNPDPGRQSHMFFLIRGSCPKSLDMII